MTLPAARGLLASRLGGSALPFPATSEPPAHGSTVLLSPLRGGEGWAGGAALLPSLPVRLLHFSHAKQRLCSGTPWEGEQGWSGRCLKCWDPR